MVLISWYKQALLRVESWRDPDSCWLSRDSASVPGRRLQGHPCGTRARRGAGSGLGLGALCPPPAPTHPLRGQAAGVGGDQGSREDCLTAGQSSAVGWEEACLSNLAPARHVPTGDTRGAAGRRAGEGVRNGVPRSGACGRASAAHGWGEHPGREPPLRWGGGGALRLITGFFAPPPTP